MLFSNNDHSPRPVLYWLYNAVSRELYWRVVSWLIAKIYPLSPHADKLQSATSAFIL